MKNFTLKLFLFLGAIVVLSSCNRYVCPAYSSADIKEKPMHATATVDRTSR